MSNRFFANVILQEICYDVVQVVLIVCYSERESVFKKVFMGIIVVSLSSLLLAHMFAWPWRVEGDCMEPAVQDGQLCFLNKTWPQIRGYKRGDIILFTHENKVWISRIVALEKDQIKITEGHVIINRSPEDSIHRNWINWKLGTYAINESYQVPSGHVFVLSDNLSAQHDDSRVFGPIAMKLILGSCNGL